MNAIPLRAPSGLIYAYACGHCHHVPAFGAMLCMPDKPGPIEQLVESSRRSATACCTCHSCDAFNPRGNGLYCKVCDWWLDWRNAWLHIGQGTLNQPCPICHAGITTKYCRDTPACVDCGEDHGGIDGRCRECNLEHCWQEARSDG